MSITPRGMSITEAYRIYREKKGFIVNRRYQRKLVWTEQEKCRLIDSILHDYPIPLILLADIGQNGDQRYEIIDGMQRLNAIFSFIENVYHLDDGHYFDPQQLTRAKQAAENGIFIPAPSDKPRLTPAQCAQIVDYQLAVTIFPGANEASINDIFGRINSQGKQLSHQEQRQAGNVTAFAQLVRETAAEVRGDASREVLPLNDMPDISIETRAVQHGYGIKAEDTFWCRQGVLRTSGLRDSEDEQMIADLLISILQDEPFAMDKKSLDSIYAPQSDEHGRIDERLAAYPAELLQDEVKTVFSILERVVVDGSPGNTFSKVVKKKHDGNPAKAPFYAVFMSFFDLVVRKKCEPVAPVAIMQSLDNVAELLTSARSITSGSRKKNIATVTGQIQDYFAHADPSLLGHGPGLAMDFENSLRRSAVESARYEFKQGLLDLSQKRKQNTALIARLAEIACSIANIGPDSQGFIFLGVADNQADAKRIEKLDKIRSRRVNHVFVVGLEREANILGRPYDTYKQQFVQQFRETELSEPLKSAILSKVDNIDYYGLQVFRIVIPPQREMSWVGDSTFARNGANTNVATGKQIAAIQSLFSTGR